MVDAVVMKHHARNDCALPARPVSKYEALKMLSSARGHYDLSDRDLTVLQALISFHPEKMLDPTAETLVVYPSNAAICERLNGMADSTMRRHLGRLVAAGVILRRDSANGKRFARQFGDRKVAYGFDLSPLLRQFARFCHLAEQERQASEARQALRHQVSLMRRDLAGLAEYGAATRPDLALWDRLSDLAALTARALRRKLSLEDLQAIEAKLSPALREVNALMSPEPEAQTEVVETAKLSSNDAQIEQHHQNSNKDSFESDSGGQVGQMAPAPQSPAPGATLDPRAKTETHGGDPTPNLPLAVILEQCHEIQSFVGERITSWHQMVQAADFVCPMMGISKPVWTEAMRAMGPQEAAVVVAAMLERFAEIKSPGGYLRYLARQAAKKAFSSGPMILALRNRVAA